MGEFTEFDIKMMRRCLDLAGLGGREVRANPMVGAVVTYRQKIIGEGYHKYYGGPHAEIEALRSIAPFHKDFLGESTMYVSLEPCNHHGKTPPCTEAILDSGLKRLVVANLDPNPLMRGQSLEKLRQEGVEVMEGLLRDEGRMTNKKFFVNHTESIPYVILKWAQSKDGYFGLPNKQVWLTNEQSRLLTHRWRGEIDGILVGTNTVEVDDPQLTNRIAKGDNPHRFVLDATGRLDPKLRIFDQSAPTTLFTSNTKVDRDGVQIIVIPEGEWSLKNILEEIYKLGITNLMIEGGAILLKSIIKENLWHEARILHSSTKLNEGIKAPMVKGKIDKKYQLDNDKVFIINNLHFIDKLISR